MESKSPPSGTPSGTKVVVRDWPGGGIAQRPVWGQSSKRKILYQLTVGINIENHATKSLVVLTGLRVG